MNEPCDHKGIGKPGCAICDPRWRERPVAWPVVALFTLAGAAHGVLAALLLWLLIPNYAAVAPYVVLAAAVGVLIAARPTPTARP